MFNVITKPLEAHAIVGIDDALAFIIGSVALSIGFSIATGNSNLPGACREIYENFIGPAAKAAVDKAVEDVQRATIGFMVFENMQIEAWEDLTTGIINYVNDAANNVVSNNIPLTVGASGKVGFTQDSLFSFQLPNTLETNEEVTICLTPTATLALFRASASNIGSSYPELDANPNYSQPGRILELRLNNGLKYVYVHHSSTDNRSYYAGTYQAVKYTPTNQDINPNTFYLSINPNVYLFRLISSSGDKSGFYYNSTPYYPDCENGKYGLFNAASIVPFQGKYFDSYKELYGWLCEEANFAIDLGTIQTQDKVDDYAPPATSVPITGDPTAAQTRANSLAQEAAQTEAQTVDVNIPTTQEAFEVAAANPAVVLDPAAAAELDIPVKPADLPDIDTGSVALWTTKFPFCLPFDIARIIGGFSATPVIPKLSFILIPANSFGLSNEEIRVEIDFEPYDVFVKILRFFISAGFVFFLIKITRKIIS